MSSSEDLNLAIFCDFENVALGVSDARIEKFDINRSEEHTSELQSP